ncbi:hypothetical protein [Maridesulfovibrio ferrireducens]|uniref:hypothetical protein n=1 Tax=Maridesulfovibrio ferrireducens TaxID=246191 RepID=UPI001A231E72|nr:hypothetical protein [Maridesulfovibrio ferrireducens]MBI9109990.1 hypothetical protein [Maridesulfovibrio ferrireducens]
MNEVTILNPDFIKELEAALDNNIMPFRAFTDFLDWDEQGELRYLMDFMCKAIEKKNEDFIEALKGKCHE